MLREGKYTLFQNDGNITFLLSLCHSFLLALITSASVFHSTFTFKQRAKKVVSDSPGLVDFAIGLVVFVLNLPDGLVLFFGKFKLQKDCNQSC